MLLQGCPCPTGSLFKLFDMKRFSIAVFSLFLCLGLKAQTYTTWPYLYPQFTDGVIFLLDGQKVYHKLNVHLLKSRLHYLEANVVKEALSRDIFYVTIGEDKFMVVNGDVMQVVAETKGGFVAKLVKINEESLYDSGGAYGGTTTTSATRNLSSVEISGGANMNHMLLLQNKETGKEVSLKEEYYLVANDTVYRAYRKDVERMLGPELHAEFRNYLKQNKIKWKDPSKLILVVDFLIQNN